MSLHIFYLSSVNNSWRVLVLPEHELHDTKRPHTAIRNRLLRPQQDP